MRRGIEDAQKRDFVEEDIYEMSFGAGKAAKVLPRDELGNGIRLKAIEILEGEVSLF